ncbi:ester cyclase [Halomonas organivorans]
MMTAKRIQELAERNAANVRRFLHDTHEGRLEVVDELVDPGIVTHGFPGDQQPASREAYKAFFTELARTWSEMTFELHALVADADRVAARFTVSGRHAGEFMGLPATGRRVVFQGMALYRMVGGRIAETWLHPDNASIHRQLTARAHTGAIA